MKIYKHCINEPFSFLVRIRYGKSDMKNYNTILTEKQQKYPFYHTVK